LIARGLEAAILAERFAAVIRLVALIAELTAIVTELVALIAVRELVAALISLRIASEIAL
jgi:hypothetical protein